MYRRDTSSFCSFSPSTLGIEKILMTETTRKEGERRKRIINDMGTGGVVVVVVVLRWW
jgi:hypothetical protein